MNIFRLARAGTATTTYPDFPEPAPLAYRGQVLLHTDRCIGDGACARACPSGAISVTATSNGGWTWELDDACCVFCGLCAGVCPTAAVKISNEFELAVRDRGALAVRTTFDVVPVRSLGDEELS